MANSRSAMPLKFRYIFVVTYGRSGSTLLNGILNSIPGVCVRGENWNTLFHLYCAIHAAERAAATPRMREVHVHPWYGSTLIDPDGFRRKILDSFLQDVLKPPEHAIAIGFKEIRYDIAAMSDEQYDRYIDFLLSTFNRAAIIFNSRRWQDVAKSDWWLANPFARSFVRNCEARFERSLRQHPGATFKVEYDRYAGNPDELLSLYDFLGAEFDRDAIVRVLALPHSYHSRPDALQAFRQARSVIIASLESLTRWLRQRASAPP